MARQVTIGIDMGGTKVLGLAVDDEGVGAVRGAGAHARGACRPRSTAGDAGRVDAVIEALGVGDRAAARGDRRRGGVGRGGGARPRRQHRGAALRARTCPGATGSTSRGRLSARLGGLRTVVDNDATCATVGEWAFGAAAGVTDAVMVTLGTGIGGGVIAGGHVVRGASGFAGEIGHMVVDPTGPPCPCGKRGCWERFASGSGLGRLAREAAHAGRLDEVVRLAGGDAESVQGGARDDGGHGRRCRRPGRAGGARVVAGAGALQPGARPRPRRHGLRRRAGGRP